MEWSMILQSKVFLLLSFLCCVRVSQAALIFTLPSYDASVPETFPEDGFDLPSDGFLRVACIDEATGIPITTVEYSITGGNSGPFEVNPTNGDLSVTDGQILDYETATSYVFTVMCTNTSNVTLTATAPVTITLEPVNEFQPVVSGNNLIISVAEITPIGTILASTQPGGLRTYSVTDRDAGPDGVITYTLVQDETSNSFRVNLTTGSLELVQSLDVDNTRNPFVTISVVITACDENPPRLDCPNIRISLFINAVNDNNPVFLSDRYEVSLPESAPIGTVIATPECTDGDVGAGEYQGIEIVSNNDNGLFIIPDERNGTVILNGTLDYSITPVHNVTLICRDTGGRNASTYLVVNVDAIIITESTESESTSPSNQTDVAPTNVSNFQPTTVTITTQVEVTSDPPTILPDVTTNAGSNSPLTTTQVEVTSDSSTVLPASSSNIGLILIIVAASVLLIVIIGSTIFCLVFCLHHHKRLKKEIVTPTHRQTDIEMTPQQGEGGQPSSSPQEDKGAAFDNRIYMALTDTVQAEENMYAECRQPTSGESLDNTPDLKALKQGGQEVTTKPMPMKQLEETDNVGSVEGNKQTACTPSITVSKEIDWNASPGDRKIYCSEADDLDWGTCTVSSLPKKSKGLFKRK